MRNLKSKSAYTTVTIRHNDYEDDFSGYIVAESESLICLWVVEDWHHNGFLVSPKNVITNVKHEDYELKAHEILMKEGVASQISAPRKLNIDSYWQMFKSLKNENQVIVIESKYDQQCAVGLITNVNKSEGYLDLKGFDACAKWFKGTFRIPFNDILFVKFDDEYSSVLYKYCDSN